MNNKSDNKKINKNIKSKTTKKEKKPKISPVKNKSLSSKNIIPYDTSYFNDKNQNNNNNNEDNVIANILKTNNIESKLYYKEDEKNYNKIKYTKKNSSSSININNEFNNIGDFSYINISEKVKPFIYKPQKNQEYSSHAFNNFNFLDISNTYRMIINILIDDDSLHSSEDLLKIFESIILSLNSLGEINISNRDFLVCIFFQHFSYEETFREIFPGLNFYNCNNWNLKMNTFYCSYGDVLSVNDTPINILSFYKESATFVEVYKFFYCNILNDLITLINVDPKEIGKTFLIVNWPNGKIYEKSSNKYHKSRILSNIFRISNNRNIVLIPDIDYCPCGNKDYLGHIIKYNFDSDKVYINLVWYMSSGYPIDHRFFFINMNYKLYLIIKEYYQNIINIYSNEYYHDYNLTIYLKRKLKDITIQKIQQIKIEYSDLPSNLIDFFYDFSLRKGSEYANFCSLISYFFSCNNMTFSKFLQKFPLLIKLLCFFIEFFWLGLSLLISYAVYNETFGTESNKMDYFCSLGYAIIVIVLLFISLIFIKNKPKIKSNKIYRNIGRNKDSYVILLILYIVHYVYNIFFIICSIIGIAHVNEGRNKSVDNKDYYIFRKKYFIILIILFLIFSIAPSFVRPTNLASKGLLFYIFIQLLNSPCYFHIPYLFTCIRNINSSKRNYESLYIIIYTLLNGLLTIICLVFDTKRQRRMDFIHAIFLILVILSGLKMVIIIIGICIQNKFIKKISTGQLPQYNIENSEYNKNLNDNNFNTYNNDDLKLHKKESNLPIKCTYENQNMLQNNNNMDNNILKNKIGFEKDYSSQMDIIPNNNLFLNESFDKNENNKIEEEKIQKSEKKLSRNYPILNFNENNISQFNSIKKDLFSGEQLNQNENQRNVNETETNLYNNEIMNNYNLNINNFKNNNDIKGISYPLDSEITNKEDNNNNNSEYNNNYNIDYNNNNYNTNDNNANDKDSSHYDYDYNNNYVMKEMEKIPENNTKEFVLDENDIYYNEDNNSINNNN